MRILIVDDQPRARQSMKAWLQAGGQFNEIHEATNGEEAIRLIESLQPEVVIMDARMPVIDGLEATKRIKVTWPQVKIIILSMYLDLQLQALSAGADAFVCKSDPPEKLRKTLAEVLQSNQGVVSAE
jgi:DNA-binding NarL/FixJ family response regulator